MGSRGFKSHCLQTMRVYLHGKDFKDIFRNLVPVPGIGSACKRPLVSSGVGTKNVNIRKLDSTVYVAEISFNVMFKKPY